MSCMAYIDTLYFCIIHCVIVEPTLLQSYTNIALLHDDRDQCLTCKPLLLPICLYVRDQPLTILLYLFDLHYGTSPWLRCHFLLMFFLSSTSLPVKFAPSIARQPGLSCPIRVVVHFCMRCTMHSLHFVIHIMSSCVYI